MFHKKVLVSAIASAAVLGLSSVAFANGGGYGAAPVAAAPVAAPMTTGAGFVVGVQGGYADTHYDNLANALNNQLGYAMGVIDGNGFAPNTTFSAKHTGFAARGYVGYDFNQYLGVEAGYLYLPKAKFQVAGQTKASIKSYAIDAFGKLMYPVADGFGVYAKAGGAYLHAKDDGGSASHFGPAYGVGAFYQIIPNLAVDVSWTRYNGDNKMFNSDGTLNNKYIPNADVAMLGLSYKFPVNI